MTKIDPRSTPRPMTSTPSVSMPSQPESTVAKPASVAASKPAAAAKIEDHESLAVRNPFTPPLRSTEAALQLKTQLREQGKASASREIPAATAFGAAGQIGPTYEQWSAKHPFDWNTIQPKDTSYNSNNAYGLAIASKLAMEPESTIRAYMEPRGFKVDFFDDPKTGAQAFLASRDGYSVLSFRATEANDKRDIITDLRMNQVPGYGGAVHAGFSQAVDSVWPQISKALDAAGRDKPLLVTGCSLGAAMATLAAERLNNEGVLPSTVVTFGSPRVGNYQFAQHYNESPLGQRTWRFRNNNDPIASFPPREPLGGYTHVGTQMYFKTDGSLQADPNFWELRRDQAAGAASFLGKVLQGQQNFNPLNDHFMFNYLDLLSQNLNVTAQPSSNPAR